MNAHTCTIESLKEKVSDAAVIIAKTPFIMEAMAEVNKYLSQDLGYHEKKDIKKALKMDITDEVMKDSQNFSEAYIWQKLNDLGIYQNDQSSVDLFYSDDCSEGMARAIFCEANETKTYPNLPILRFKSLWKILKDSDADKKREEKTQEELMSFESAYEELGRKMTETIKSVKHPGQWKDKELLESYSDTCDTEIIRILSERSKGRPFLIYKNEKENIVDIDSSLRMLREARHRETPVHYKASDILKRLYRAGEFPALFYYESPFAKGVLLFDGYCEETKQIWSEIDYEIMQFARIAFELGEAPKEMFGMRQFINNARQDGINGLIQDYPETYLKFKEAKELGTLPVLKKRISDNTGKKQDPFGSSKNNTVF